jgi:DNA-binding response OmpR family regulator
MTSSPNAPPHRVLVVDDEPHLVRAVRMYLELQGYTVFGAHSGKRRWRRSAKSCRTW